MPKQTVTIDCAFGSEIQREVALKTLTELIAIWRREVEKRHKKNKVKIESVTPSTAFSK
jgi:hypothetical protein